ncbi:hypothetical protein [Falsiroseomonas sp.]|uniref:hypothetical protein n=1 Tax=Falsiroseomonas sp. TaxID=2870721 RepID=UPI003569701F
MTPPTPRADAARWRVHHEQTAAQCIAWGMHPDEAKVAAWYLTAGAYSAEHRCDHYDSEAALYRMLIPAGTQRERYTHSHPAHAYRAARSTRAPA